MNYRKHKLYGVFRSMKARCYKDTHKDYKNYGARGITIEFIDYKDFIDWALQNGYEEGLEIDKKIMMETTLKTTVDLRLNL